MKVKFFSVRMDETFGAIRIGPTSGYQPGTDYLEQAIQAFLDEHPRIEIVHVQSSTVAVVPRNASWSTTNTPIEWQIEQSVILFYREGI